MAPRIGIIGVPLETVPIKEEFCYVEAVIPGITDDQRALIIRKVNEQRIPIEDLGEVYLSEDYDPGFSIDRLAGVPWFFLDKIVLKDMDKLNEERERVLKLSEGYDLFVAIGLSHLGAIILYKEGDKVGRCDYHGDFSGKKFKKANMGHASYLDWVKHELKDVDVTNYFVKDLQDGLVFGRMSHDPNDLYSTLANHYDIDVDCFRTLYRIQDIYPHKEGDSEATPDMVCGMIERAKPNRLGFWEHRLSRDLNGNGIDFMVNTIISAINS